MDVELHQTMKKMLHFKGTSAEELIKNEWIIYKCLIIQCMLDIIILAQTEIQVPEKVDMITSILCEKIQDQLVEDRTNIVQLLINQTFPINLVDILIERVEHFHVAIHFIENMLSTSLTDLHPIIDDHFQVQAIKEDDMLVDKMNSLELSE